MEIHDAQSFADYFDGVRSRTRRAVMSIPPECIEWTHTKRRWTFGDLVRHLGGVERWMWAENAMRRPSRYPGHGRELADGHEAVVAYLDHMHAQSMAILRALTAGDLNARCMTVGGAEMVVWKWLRAMVEHEVHHRGQIHLMLSMLGVSAAPIFGLTEEEVFARSVAPPAARS